MMSDGYDDGNGMLVGEVYCAPPARSRSEDSRVADAEVATAAQELEGWIGRRGARSVWMAVERYAAARERRILLGVRD